MLVWARDRSGLSLEDAAKKINLASSATSSAVEKIKALESGDQKPTRNQLLKIADVYRMPLIIFYRERPPKIAERGEDYRTIIGPVSFRENALLDTLVRDVKVKQDLVKSILEEEEDASALKFVNSISTSENIVDVSAKIRAILEIQNEDWTTNYTSVEALFKDFRNKVEELGVFVLLLGNLGSYHTNISEQVFRGFAIADDIAPFIIINDQDAKTAQVFTLAHELVHLFAGKTGISGAPTTATPRNQRAKIERFCNDVGSEILLPESVIIDVDNLSSISEAEEVILKLAVDRNISEPMVAYRLRRLGQISLKVYSQLQKKYEQRWKKQKEINKQKRKESENGPSYYIIHRHRLGNALLNFIGRALREKQIVHTKAALILGVKPTSVEPMLKGVKGLKGLFYVEGGR